MAKKRQPWQRKLRTREHILEDLSVNHVERQILLCGWSVERVRDDCGIDLILFTYNDAGETDYGPIFLQVKSTEQLKRLQSGDRAVFRLNRADLIGWLSDRIPIILVTYEAANDCAYWIRIQSYFAAIPNFNIFEVPQTLTIHLPVDQILNPAAVRQFAGFRDRVSTPNT